METIDYNIAELSERQRSTVKLAARTHGVSAHGGVVKALIRKGLAREGGPAYGGGTTVRLTRDGYRAGRSVLVAEAARRREQGLTNAAIEDEIAEVEAKIERMGDR